MRWIYVAGAAGVAATITSDIWFDVDYGLNANIALLCIAVLAVLFAVLYAGRSRWWTNRIGKIYLAKSLILALVLLQAVVSVWWQDDYPGRQIIRFIIYSLGAVTYVPMLWSLWREQQRDRRGQQAPTGGG
ncbi:MULTISPECIES: putative phage holin [Mycolicibacterium]|jgi:FlaA1/EpsC-like NDP-sugar epimerase|uniref:Holin n=3 Tax=Mycolicibacterium TaxID=1866885 RepID=A0AAE4VHT9_MYCFO|nr:MULTISPECIES: hypothetical protein [Mycolicibacterium]KLI05015.1 hypothetical protein AA982_27155 [Mycolicibacterium senegalense]KLO53867.1 hypothetical protein ABW05_22650 [Mycolicibacterium senegalense]KMV15411.1 hypothetical protein ACT17_25625 [Mycolicibacterium conceptionense]MDV7194263.1 hypothetical protein [Mycolicibacterium fortuitum]MDV7294318.1 hypothetical protein [Mycolicibacterium fortuitum]